MRYMEDAIDTKAMRHLMLDGRASWADLGTALGLSAPAAAERVRKLEDRGVIRGYAALPDPDAAGFPVLAFVSVTLVSQNARASFLKAVRAHPLIQECHHVAGDDDFLLKVRCRGMRDLDALLSDDLKGRLGVARTRTTIVLGTVKETVALPIGPVPVGKAGADAGAPATAARPRRARRAPRTTAPGRRARRPSTPGR
jgi:Lrp/AsnC family transcriptional regulator, leucine-responsive regulatory protein